MNCYTLLRENLPLVESKMRYTFKDPSLIELAFTHRSFANENRTLAAGHNERLEFLGDAILGLMISDYLYTLFPERPEGELSYIRSRLVEGAACIRYVQSIGLEEFVMVGRGEALNAGKGRDAILADLFEALIGALYLDGGLEVARTFFFNHFEEEIAQIINNPERNWKAELQDFCQKQYQCPPCYVLLREEGPDHLKKFYVRVQLREEELGVGEGLSKKEAEQLAARRGIERLGL